MTEMNLKLILLVATVACIVTPSIARSLRQMDNNILPLSHNEWVKIKKSPPAQVNHVRGTTLELECIVIGSPTPDVHWVHGSGQMVDWDDYDTNIISESSPTASAFVVSRLVLDHSTHATERTFTCVGRVGGKRVYATTTVYEQDKEKSNLTGHTSSNHGHFFGQLKKARITHFFQTLLDEQGSTVVLPCKTVGRPVPEVYWLNEAGEMIDDTTNPRYKTLPTGELIISSLSWSDMGAYTCVAQNAISKDTASTFIYPSKPE